MADVKAALSSMGDVNWIFHTRWSLVDLVAQSIVRWVASSSGAMVHRARAAAVALWTSAESWATMLFPLR
eukprot:11118695-Heterocapsa_arctica.AAC.1